MRFETSKSTPPHLDRRLQLRMLAFVGLIGVIMFVMSTFQANQKQKGKDRPLPGAPDPSVFQVDQDRLRDDEFLMSPEDGERTPKPMPREPVWQEPPLVDGLPVETRDGVDQEIARLETEFDRGILRRVKDNTIGILSGEADAYYRLLDHARRVSVAELEKAGATDVQYINLMEQPDRFRGEAVTIYGDLWRLYEFKAGPNDRGLKTVYEAWIFTADSEKHPYRVVFTHLPHELQPGENLRKAVRVTGYFFKREGYASKGGMHVAPLLLANRVIPFRPPEAIPEAGAIIPYMIGIISAIGLAFLVTLFSFAISDRRAARAALLRDLNAPRPSFEGIDAGPMFTVQESLRQMEDEEWEASAEAETKSADVSAALHARDRTKPADRPTLAATAAADELAERRRDEVRAVQAWTQQHGARNGEHRAESQADQTPDTSQTESKHESTALINGASNSAGHNHLSDEQRAAQQELERDHAARELELSDRLRHQRAELNHEREEREAREREQAEREQRDAIDQEQRRTSQVRPPLASEHLTIDRANRIDQSEDVPAKESSESTETNDDPNSSDWSYDQGRRRRRDRR